MTKIFFTVFKINNKGVIMINQNKLIRFGKYIEPDVKEILNGAKTLNKTVKNKVVQTINNPQKTIQDSLTDIVTINSKDVSKTAKKVLNPLTSISEKALDIMETSDIAVIQNGAKFIKNNPKLNPTKVSENIINIIDNKSKEVETNIEQININVAKSVIKKKTKYAILKNKFINFFINIFNKIKNKLNKN